MGAAEIIGLCLDKKIPKSYTINKKRIAACGKAVSPKCFWLTV